LKKGRCLVILDEVKVVKKQNSAKLIRDEIKRNPRGNKKVSN